MSTHARLDQQIGFIVEIDRLKEVLRQSLLTQSRRRENSAEHSWHFALLAVTLREYAPFPELDLLRVLKMILIHDLVEIDAGDTYCYDAAGNQDKALREQCAADRIFNLLPLDQANEIRSLWDEFEAQATPEAKYAAALDRVQPVLLNYHTQGQSWREHGVTLAQVLERNRHIEAGAPALWAYVRELIDDALAKGWIKR
jgi:5'-deoxynucleotidase YfbR-like HD superfamily hydrolase